MDAPDSPNRGHQSFDGSQILPVYIARNILVGVDRCVKRSCTA